MFEASVSALLLVAITLISAAIITVIRWLWKMVKRVWLNPKTLERELRKQNLKGNPYRLWVGDLKELVKMKEHVTSKPMFPSHSHDLPPYVSSFVHHLVNKYGKNSFMWFGTTPRVILMDPEKVKEVFNRNYDFPKPEQIDFVKYIATGVGNYEDHRWTKHRKIINPAFHLEQLKSLIPSFFQSCNDMIRKWEDMLSSSSDETCEMDIRPWLKNFTEDAISRTAFGSSYEEGRKIFELLSELGDLLMKNAIRYHNPLWSLIHAKDKRRMKEINGMVEASLMGIIEKKEKAMKTGEAPKSDLLGILLESNHKEIEDQGGRNGNKSIGLSMKDVIEECKLFYFAGQETSSSMLVWTMMLLARYPDWQVRAREEVLRVFGNKNPDYEGLSRLKIVTMILYEVLRLYPPAGWLTRCPKEDMKLGDLLVPGGVQILLPILMLHHDKEIWGDDASEFKPERFSEGISNAGKGSSAAFLPFGWGPRICIGQNFALLEAKMALSLILQHFCFDLSPTYSHAPIFHLTIQPRHGVHIILHKL